MIGDFFFLCLSDASFFGFGDVPFECREALIERSDLGAFVIGSSLATFVGWIRLSTANLIQPISKTVHRDLATVPRIEKVD